MAGRSGFSRDSVDIYRESFHSRVTPKDLHQSRMNSLLHDTMWFAAIANEFAPTGGDAIGLCGAWVGAASAAINFKFYQE